MKDDRHDWKNRKMPLTGPPIVATRQLTRAMRRKNKKRRNKATKQQMDRFKRYQGRHALKDPNDV